MPYSYTLTSVIPATPQEIYEAWLDSIGHSEMTGGDAVMSDELGAEVSAWNGYITGRNLELVSGERIVQSWRTREFGDEHEDSILTVTLEATDDGTLLTLVHSNVPDEHRRYEQGGWQSRYFEPMQAYFAGFDEEEAGEEQPQPVAPKPAPKPEPKRAPKRTPKPAAKVRRAAGKKAKKTPLRAKASPAKKKKAKRAAVAKKKRKGKIVKKPAKRAAAKSKSRRKKRGRR